MGKFKGILKKVTGTLKIALAVTPIVACFGGLATEVGLMVGYSVNQKKFDRDVNENPYFIERRIEDVENLSEKFASQEISEKEFSDQIDYFSTREYKEEIAKEGGEETAELQGILKTVEGCKKALIGVGVTTIAGLIATLVGVYGPTYIDDLIDSGVADFKYKSKNSPSPNNKVVAWNSNASQEPKVDEDDGFESDDRVYENIEDYIDRFQGRN